jgi:hypothetical protein
LSRTGGRKRNYKNRVRRMKHAAMCCAVLFCAGVYVLTIAARIGITALSDETARLNEQLEVLRAEERLAAARHAELWSPGRIADAAEALQMVPPGEADAVLAQGGGDCTVLYPAYQTKLEEHKTIWEYFG